MPDVADENASLEDSRTTLVDTIERSMPESEADRSTAVFIIIEPVGLSGIDRLLAEALRVCSCKLLRIPTCLPLTNRVNVYDARCNTHASTTLQTPTSACAGRRAYLSRRRRCSPSSRPRSRRHLQGLNKLLSGMIYL